ncbi:YczE/YyaS/YitT family protein [Enterococcus cecorum]|uniref:YczE/YyaS/YitT family protein n=1 Tax=Enterococcus cecorum TaxID=44008 RepID=UPI000B1A9316|nr:membrane protein [Enterococcus cecorum]CAI3368324.1 membrane protein [Enterococcus cecorum]
MLKNIQVSQLVKIIVGTLLVALGITLMITSQLGVDTLSVALFGVMNFIPWKFGYLTLTFNLIILAFALFFDRQQVGLGSFANAFGVGLTVNALTPILTASEFLTRHTYLTMALGIIVYGLGVGVYVAGNLGSAAVECLTMMIVKATRFPLRYVRISLDALMVVIGLLLGSQSFGIGTIICVITTGFIMERVLVFFERFEQKAQDSLISQVK